MCTANYNVNSNLEFYVKKVPTYVSKCFLFRGVHKTVIFTLQHCHQYFRRFKHHTNTFSFLIAGLDRACVSLSQYATVLCDNTEFLLKEEIIQIFRTLLEMKNVGKYEYYISFPKIFAAAIMHMESDCSCRLPGCMIPLHGQATKEDGSSHIQLLTPRILALTVYDLMDLGLDFNESSLPVSTSDVHQCMSDIFHFTQGPAYRSILDECLNVGKDLVGW